MSWRATLCAVFWLALLPWAAGCRPARPWYLKLKSNDLNYYVQAATSIDYPDVESPPLDEVENTRPPITLADPGFNNFWDLTLQDAISIALHNSKVIRRLAAVSQPGVPLQRPDTSVSVYDAAVVESDPQLGVEGALAAFDTQLATSIFWENRDRPQNFGFFVPVLEQHTAQFNFELSKKTATGTQLFFRNITDYDRNNNPFQSVSSAYTTAMEIEARHPLLRGSGPAVNRLPVVLARINTDITLADFEAAVRDLVLEVENAYWDLYCAYRTFEAAKIGRDRSLETWRKINKRLEGGLEPPENEPLVREQYLNFRLALETAASTLQDRENQLRWLMGLTATDGRMIRPVDEPVSARVQFDWHQIHAESLIRTAELRRQKWVIKQREMQLIAARNELLPTVNLVGLYRWLGIGDELIAASPNGIPFPRPGSRAFEELTRGNYQEVRFGVEMGLPVGFRRELAAMRNAELALIREKAKLEDLELNVSHQLTLAVRQLESNFQFAQTHLNRMIATESEEQRRAKLLIRRSDLAFLQSLLDAQRRAAQSQADYYRALCEYNKAIALVHYRKGSLLEYNNIRLAEGPWPEKAMWQAREHARRRNAAIYFDYGKTGPPVVTRSAGTPPLADTGPVPPSGTGPAPTPAGPAPPDQLRRLPPPAGPASGPVESTSQWAPRPVFPVQRTAFQLPAGTGPAAVTERPKARQSAPEPFQPPPRPAAVSSPLPPKPGPPQQPGGDSRRPLPPSLFPLRRLHGTVSQPMPGASPAPAAALQ